MTLAQTRRGAAAQVRATGWLESSSIRAGGTGWSDSGRKRSTTRRPRQSPGARRRDRDAPRGGAAPVAEAASRLAPNRFGSGATTAGPRAVSMPKAAAVLPSPRKRQARPPESSRASAPVILRQSGRCDRSWDSRIPLITPRTTALPSEQGSRRPPPAETGRRSQLVLQQKDGRFPTPCNKRHHVASGQHRALASLRLGNIPLIRNAAPNEPVGATCFELPCEWLCPRVSRHRLGHGRNLPLAPLDRDEGSGSLHVDAEASAANLPPGMQLVRQPTRQTLPQTFKSPETVNS